ncbi:MATE family efflux transporter [Halomarina litorea]|uniref:MATE family efflux transporter n=1 Tax=Halomarina litorea TaxID=2961595 RepID=UPI0020C358CA|nr:MATE family efflux transporter [Halomarina sp. BCD28]
MSSSGPTESSITEGGLARPLFALAWPIVVTELLQVAYNLADTLWLGRYSAAAVGAMSLAFPLIFLLLSVGGGFTVAGSTLVAQYTGAGGGESAGKVAGQTLSFVTLLAIVLGALGYVATGPMLGVLPTDPETAREVVPLAADYMEVFFLGTPFLFGFFVFSALMRGYGDTRTPMLVMVLSVTLNVLLDPVLIFGFDGNPLFAMLGLGGLQASLFAATGYVGSGVEGAALATLLSRVVATAVGLYLIFWTDLGPDVELAHLWPDGETIRKIVSIGTPSALEQSTSALAMITLTAMVVTFTTPVVAAYGLGNRLISLVFLPAMGLGRATNTMVGQNLGARKPDRAERAVGLAAGVGASVMLVVAVVAYLFAEPIVSVFMTTGTQDAVETIRHGTEYLRIRTVEFAFIGVLQVLLGAYRGAGNTKTALAFSLVALWVGRVPTVAYLAFVAEWGPTGLWTGMALGNVVGAIAAGAWFLRGTWKETVVEESPAGGTVAAED